MTAWRVPFFNLLVGWGRPSFPVWFLKKQYLEIILILRAPMEVSMKLVLVCLLSWITAFLLLIKWIILVLCQILVFLIRYYRTNRFESCILFTPSFSSLSGIRLWGFNAWRFFIVQSMHRSNGKTIKESMGGWKSSQGGPESGRFELWLTLNTKLIKYFCIVL